ncbi:hypothetical protein B0H63DRAFT_556790 [Podospora didyma]|uniref:Kelch repeat-containing protein n=1 Tax=Podospora didyma TaxID=330526 RepID=A0AAE0NXX1_9PEZI|nr:hypothetical protein B0H63DRAFT_556790 [Podospora didyma]
MRPRLGLQGGVGALALVLLTCTQGTTAADDGMYEIDVPPAKIFNRRVKPRATVIGDYVYIDGGEIAHYVNATPFYYVNTNNSTLSIDISKSWYASTVDIKATPKPEDRPGTVPISLNAGGIWNHPSGDGFYWWGGYVSARTRPDGISKEGIWRFTVDGRGGGSWALEFPANPTYFKTLATTEDGAYAVSRNKTAFWLGGHGTHRTDPARVDAIGVAVTGLVTYDMETKTWQNESSLGLAPPYGTIRGARMEYVPTFGPNGLMVVLGGFIWNLEPNSRTESAADFSNVTLFDPVTRKQYWQTTTGTAPPARYLHCSVGVASPGGTYEIFVFGGITMQNQALEDLYVLSLPGFVWSRAQATSPGGVRDGHTCVLAGKRQMLSIGGENDGLGTGPRYVERDLFSQGLGIFDLTNLTWSTDGHYDAEAEAYKSPKIVQEWYAKANLSKIAWTSDELKSLFITANGTSQPNQVNNDTTPPSDTTTKDTGSGGGESTGGLSSGAKIAIGVVAAMIGVALAIGATVYMTKRRYRKKLAAEGVYIPSSSREDKLQGDASPESRPAPRTRGSERELSGSSWEAAAAAKPRVDYSTPVSLNKAPSELPIHMAYSELDTGDQDWRPTNGQPQRGPGELESPATGHGPTSPSPLK